MLLLASTELMVGGRGTAHVSGWYTFAVVTVAPHQQVGQEQWAPPLYLATVTNPLPNLPPILLCHPTAKNPLFAPWDCTGTMAFVGARGRHCPSLIVAAVLLPVSFAAATTFDFRCITNCYT